MNPFDVEFKAALGKRSHDTLDSALEPMTPGPLSPIDVLGTNTHCGLVKDVTDKVTIRK